MKKTFNVWVKKLDKEENGFKICSKKTVSLNGKETKVDKDSYDIDFSAHVSSCDVSQWLETFDMKNGEVKSFKLTLKEN